MPQEKGIPRRIELREETQYKTICRSLPKPSFYDFYYIACAVTSNSYEPGSQYSIKIEPPKPTHAIGSKERSDRPDEEMANTQTSENASLKGPEDWETWNTQFKSKAISTDIWRLISPDEDEDTEPFAEKPIPPKIGDYDKKLIVRETRQQSSNATAAATAAATAQATQQPVIHIEEVDHGNKPKTAAEMTTAARQAFQLDWTLY